MKNVFLLFTFLIFSFCLHAMEENQPSQSPKLPPLLHLQRSPQSPRLFRSPKSQLPQLKRSQTAPQLRLLALATTHLNPDSGEQKKMIN